MEIYIALLRGINVSGQKLLRMNDLKSYFEELGFQEVLTYIQSGNIIFSFETTNQQKLEQMIREKILEKTRYNVPVAVLSRAELDTIIENNPYKTLENQEIEKLHLTVLEELPLQENILQLTRNNFAPEEFSFGGRYIYLFLPNGYGRAKLNNNFIEKKLKTGATTRNWKTIKKLQEMSKS